MHRNVLRISRNLTLVTAGLVIGAMLVAPVTVGGSRSTLPSAATQTRTASCQGLNFHPITNTTGYGWAGTELYIADTPGEAFFLCDPKLPDRAVVTKVQFTLRDANFVGEVRYCALYRSGLTTDKANTLQVIATVPETGIADAPGIVRKSTSSIAHGVIDNASWAYWLQCDIYFTDHTSEQLVGIYGADVVYQISAANG
jgi:hypothetical protein